MINIGVIGYGYWGPNIVRNFSGIEGVSVRAICDSHASCLDRARRACPQARMTSDLREVLEATDIDAVAVITPVSTHYDLAKRALLNGKHLFVEKPFTATVTQAEELVELAERKKLTVMVDHTFIFTGAVRRIKKLIDEDSLGRLYYYDSVRVNLGLFQRDVNVIWDLAPHDFSVMDYLVDEKPAAVSACGKAHVNGLEDTAYITVHFANNMIAHFNVNWLSPVKIRTTLIGGEKRMLVWNDMVADEKIRIYDKGVAVENGENSYDLRVSYRSGDMHAPRVETVEALRSEAEYFTSCLNAGERPMNDGLAGLRVVRLLDACSRSLKQDGRTVAL